MACKNSPMIKALILFGMLLTLGAGPSGNDLYQVISSHPHELEELSPHIETVYQNGRLWVVQLNKNAPLSIRTHLKRLSGGEKSYSYVGKHITNKLIKQKPVDIKSLVKSVTLENIKDDVAWLASYETRYVGTEDNQLATIAVAERLKTLGFSIKKLCYREDSCSIVAEKAGSVLNRDVMMVMAHIDSVGEYFAGADDNASGVSVILEMARILQNYKNQKTIRFFISNGEELDLIGSGHYAGILESTNQIKNISLAINMDMVGYNTTGVIELETDPEFEGHAQWLAGLATKYTSLKTKITLGAWGSDHVPFLKRGVPTILTIEDWDSKSPCYHKECDKPDTLNYEYATEVAKLNLSALLAKDLE